MKGAMGGVWEIRDPVPGRSRYAKINGKHFTPAVARRVADHIAQVIRKPVVLVKLRHNNPSLAHHLGARAYWHIWTDTGHGHLTAVADIYKSGEGMARQIAQAYADGLHVPVKLARNEGDSFARHQAEATTFLRGRKPSANPKGHDPALDDAVRRISAGLRLRSGKSWSVTRGRGSVYGWIYIKARGHDLGRRVHRAAVAATRRRPGPGNAAKAIYYLQHHQVRSAMRKAGLRGRRNPGRDYHRAAPPVGSMWDRINYPRHVARVVSTDRAQGGMPPMVNLEIVSASGREVYGTSRIPVNVFAAEYERRAANPSRSKRARARRQTHRQDLGSRRVRRSYKSGRKAKSRYYATQSATRHYARRVRGNPQTFREWSERYGIDMRRHKSGAYWVPDSFTSEATRRQLWDLSDYLVSSVSGGTIWLVKRTRKNAPTPVAGEIWTTGGGKRCKIISATKARVHVLHMETGNREWIDMPEFLASYRPSARRNPRIPERAAKTFKDWHEFDASGTVKVSGPDRKIPKVLVGLGEVSAIEYRSDKRDGGRNTTGKVETYRHTTKAPRPILATDPDGKHVHLVGGRMKVTPLGLVN